MELCVCFLGLLHERLLALELLLTEVLVVLGLQRPAVHNTVADTGDQGRVTNNLQVNTLLCARTFTTGEGDIISVRRRLGERQCDFDRGCCLDASDY